MCSRVSPSLPRGNGATAKALSPLPCVSSAKKCALIPGAAQNDTEGRGLRLTPVNGTLPPGGRCESPSSAPAGQHPCAEGTRRAVRKPGRGSGGVSYAACTLRFQTPGGLGGWRSLSLPFADVFYTSLKKQRMQTLPRQSSVASAKATPSPARGPSHLPA